MIPQRCSKHDRYDDCEDAVLAHQRKRISESEFERIVDRAVQNRLQRSNSYRWAASAEEQSEVEERITQDALRHYETLYEIV